MTTASARHPAIFRALAPTTGGLVAALRVWARENNVDEKAMELAIRFRRDHASNLADTQVQRLAVLLETVLITAHAHYQSECPKCGTSDGEGVMTEPTGTVATTCPRDAYRELTQKVMRLCPGADMEITEKTANAYTVEIRTDRAGIAALLERDRLTKAFGRN